jgi:hypothetical protein
MPMLRATAAAIAVAGLLGAAVPHASPVRWSPRLGPVPQAKTTAAPAFAQIALGKDSSRLFLFWIGPSDQSGSEISYQRSIDLAKNGWSAPAQVAFGKARTSSRPAAAPIGAAGSGQVIVAWKDVTGAQLLYSVGREDKSGDLDWVGTELIPGAKASGGPSVFRPLHSNVILVTWRAASGRGIDYVVGDPDSAGKVTWGAVGVIPHATTASTPALAEASTGSHGGPVYVLWQVPGSAGRIGFSTTPEPAKGVARWSAPRLLPSSVSTGQAPSAQAIGKNLAFPLLVVFGARHGSALSYLTLAKNGTITGPLKVPQLRSSNGTAISADVLAAEAPDPGQIFYEPFVRACAGC